MYPALLKVRYAEINCVNATAQIPNATDKNEIRAAFDNLINVAS